MIIQHVRSTLQLVVACSDIISMGLHMVGSSVYDALGILGEVCRKTRRQSKDAGLYFFPAHGGVHGVGFLSWDILSARRRGPEDPSRVAKLIVFLRASVSFIYGNYHRL